MVHLDRVRGMLAAVQMKRPGIGRFRSGFAMAMVLTLAACGGPTPQTPSPPSQLPPVPQPPPPLPPPPTPSADCANPAFSAAAATNAAGMGGLAFNLFGRAESGWAVYGPVIQREIATNCAPDSPGFAAALAAWAPGRAPDGVVTAGVLQAVKIAAQGRRPIASVRGRGVCPDPPDEGTLATARPEEGYGGKVVQLRPAALAAFRAMAAAARAEDPAIAADRRYLTIFSAYRSPSYDAARCARDGNCNGVTRAACSPHRTGLVVDVYVGESPGYGPDSSVDSNRLAQSRTPAYRWLVANAGRFGFVGYAFEPWHWEWTGEAP